MFIKKLLIKIAYVCMVLVWLEGCQGCHRVVISPSERSQIPDRGGIPNLGNTCYMNAVLQIIAKLYPDVFANAHSDLTKAGQVIVNKIKDDQDYVTEDAAEAFYDAFLNIHEGRGQFERDRQEDAGEFLQVILQDQGFPPSLHTAESLSTPGRHSGESDDPPMRREYHILTLSINANGDSNLNLRDLIAYYSVLEEVELDDSISGRAQKQLLLSLGSSRLLPIQLGRFNSNLNKIGANITNTMSLIISESTQYSPKGHPSDLHYDLQGFVVHKGPSMRSGHYIACIQQAGQWKLYNDETVTNITLDQAEKCARQGYLYFYRRTS